MSVRKTLLALAVGILLLTALPASASAAHWRIVASNFSSAHTCRQAMDAYYEPGVVFGMRCEPLYGVRWALWVYR